MRPSWTARIFYPRAWALLLLFVVVTSAFVRFRHTDFFVYNDTPLLVATDGSEPETWPRVDESHAKYVAQWARDPVGQCVANARAAFQNPTPDGYRPLDSLQGRLSRAASRSNGPTRTQLLIFGSLYGAFAVCLFLIARRFAKFDATALLAVVLMFGSPPLVSSSWVVIVGIQAIVPLMICLALLLYWSILDEPRRRWLKVSALGAVLLFGPWFREFCGISCLLIGFLELRRARRPTPLMAMAGVFFLHAVFPTALIKCLFFPELPLLPVTRLGSLSSAMHSDGIHWYMAWEFLPLLPPLLMVLTTCNAAGRACQELIVQRPRSWSDVKTHGWKYCITGIIPALWLATILTLWLMPYPGGPELLGFTLCLYIAIVGLQVDLFLAVWFLLAFVPLMRVAVETVHFLYALVPASIILACAMESLWQWAAARQGALRAVRYALTLALGIIVADQLLVIYGSYRVMHGESDSVRAVAAELRRRIPQGSVVISNVIHGVEIQWASGDHYANHWSLPWLKRVSWSQHHPARVIDDPDRFKQLLVKSAARSRVFLLDCDFDYLPNKVGHRHQFVHRFEIDKQSLGKIHTYSATYLFADPLRHWVSRPNVPFLGPPDLVNDFYRGHAIDGCWFKDQVYAEYHLYEVTGTHVQELAAAQVVDSIPRLAAAAVHGFNIVACEGKFFGVSEMSGPFDMKRVRGHEYAVCFEGTSVEQVRRMIDESLLPAVGRKADRGQTTQ